MAKGVFVHRSDSVYDDFPEERYQFPRQYLKRAKAFEGDWVVYYEPLKARGRRGYFAVARIQKIVADPAKPDMYLALIEPGSYLQLERFVPHRDAAGFMESALQNDDGSLNRGRIQWAVRPISDRDFERILAIGLPDDEPPLPRADLAPLTGRGDGLLEDSEPFVFDAHRKRVSQLGSRVIRDRAFRRVVLDAYDSRCAITGLKLINGRGRAEVEAAHIKPVKERGPDVVRNGIALSGTVHWMFDRGLIGLSDQMEILVSRQVNDPDQVLGLLNDTGVARVPEDTALQPHPRYLAWHREYCFKH